MPAFASICGALCDDPALVQVIDVDRRSTGGSAVTSDLDLSGQLVLLSGAVGGLGRVICSRLAAWGADVVGCDIRLDALTGPPGDRASAENERIGRGRIRLVQADVSVPDEVARVLEGVVATEGRLPDTVCCHAGMTQAAPILEYPVEDFDRLFRVNVRSAFVLAQASATRWRDASAPGNLIFTSSWVEDHPWPGIAPYCASKAALHSLMQSFAKELAPINIRANSILPGIVSVGMARRQWDEDSSFRARAAKTIALGGLQSPESVADAFGFLCSPLSSYMTGASLRVDGGCSLQGAEP